MDEAEAKNLLGNWIQLDGSLFGVSPYETASGMDGEFLEWRPGLGDPITLNGTFSPVTLQAILWWVHHKGRR